MPKNRALYEKWCVELCLYHRGPGRGGGNKKLTKGDEGKGGIRQFHDVHFPETQKFPGVGKIKHPQRGAVKNDKF